MLRLLVISFLLLPLNLLCLDDQATKTNRQQYIDTWKNEAIYQMAVHKIPASITLAQGILESGDGNSRLAREGNNHFGIKCHADWKGKTIHEDDETAGECFRKYDNAKESYEDHSAFLQRKRYESLFLLEPDDYKGWAKGLKKCGYATNPKYPELLIGIIEEFQLHQYDKDGLKYIKENKTPSRSGGSAPAVEKTAEPEEKKPARKGRNKNRNNDDEPRMEITIGARREIKVSDNRIKYVVVKENESLEDIASELEMNSWQLKRYNDLDGKSSLKAGQLLYTQPKRNKAKENSYTVKNGDTAWSISQSLGIKLKKLKELNGLSSDQVTPGTVLKLRK